MLCIMPAHLVSDRHTILTAGLPLLDCAAVSRRSCPRQHDLLRHGHGTTGPRDDVYSETGFGADMLPRTTQCGRCRTDLEGTLPPSSLVARAAG